MAVVTKQELEDASVDAQTLEDVINGAADLNGNGTVTSRLGQTLKTVAKSIQDINTLGVVLDAVSAYAAEVGAPASSILVDSSGNVLVGKTSSDFSVAGIELAGTNGMSVTRDSSLCVAFNRKTTLGDVLSFSYNGTEVGSVEIDSASSVAFRTSSDHRLKGGVEDLTGAIDRVKLLKPRRFYWLSDDTQRMVDGFIAHEAQEVVPEAVSKTKDAMKTVVIQEAVEAQPAVLWTEEDELPEGVVVGDVKTEAVEAVTEVTEEKPDYQGIDQSKIVPLLTSALQEAIGEIESLKARITALESA